MTATPFGFRVLGDLSGPRRLIDYWRAYSAYCRADPGAQPEIPAYLSAFVYGGDFRCHLATTGSTRDFGGSVGVPAVHWDIDREDNLKAALHDSRRLAAFLEDHYRLDSNALLVGFSGSKGFHIELPIGWQVEPNPWANLVCRRFAEAVAARIGITIDTGVYDKVRAFRIWNSRHPKSGLYKIKIDTEDLLHGSVQWILGQATEPIPFEPLAPSACPAAEADWRLAEKAVRAGAAERRARTTRATNARITRATWEVFTNPIAVEVGTRHARLFQAAANLAEFGTIEELITGLLTEPGLDTGLPPREVARQIECGIQHARRHRGGEEDDE
jgi:hypothetical protein